MAKTNQDIRDYMADHGVTQKTLAKLMGTNQSQICKKLNTELSQQEKEEWLNKIDSVSSVANECDEEVFVSIDPDEFIEETDEETVEDVSCSAKFQIGDRVKILSKSDKVGVVSDIWSSLVKAAMMYAVTDESNGHLGLYAEEQLEIAPLPIAHTFESVIDGNVAVVTMKATQGEKTWIYARGHAHILHDGEVGMAQAISYAARRMFESLDRKQENQIYFKGKETRDDN